MVRSPRTLLLATGNRPERPGRLALDARAVVDRVAAVGLVAVLIGGAIVLVLTATAVLATRFGDIADFTRAHTWTVVVALAIVLAAALVLTAVTAALRRAD